MTKWEEIKRAAENIGLYVHIIKLIYLEYKDKLLGKIVRKTFIKPCMKYREIEIIENILDKLNPKKCLEWGAGYSTLYFPMFLKKEAKWIAIEHNYKWFNKIKNLNKNQNVEIFYIPIQDVKNKDLNVKVYVEYPAKFKPFDFILIDGKARQLCLKKAYELITNSGLVVLHDANRKQYHPFFHLYKYQILFEDYRNNSGGLWIGSKELNLKQILDIEKHKFYWRKISNLGNILKSFFRTERIGI